MPPAKKPPRPRPAYPQTDRCRFASSEGRCRRIATVGGELCRSHAIAIQLELDNPAGRLFEMIDRSLTGRGSNQLSQAVATMAGEALGAMMQNLRPKQRIGANHAPMPPPPKPPPAPPQPPPRDQVLEARIVLGFEEREPLTEQLVKERKRALARVFHPDAGSGSKAHMQRVNAAADLLLSKL